nr:MAG TPA: hypothetical protein [Bacteriophage sp.]
MAWVAVDSDGTEWVYEGYMPHRDKGKFLASPYAGWTGASVRLPHGTIKKLIGRELSWSDEPVELKGD